MNSMLLSVEEDDDGELVLVFHPPLLEKLGWEVGDILTWTIGEDGLVSIKKEQGHE